MTTRLRARPAHADDSGATLIFALVIITVVALVTGALLSFSDTSLRTTIGLRDQAADVYAADGATQAALDALKTSGINCNDPDPANAGHVTLGSITTPFYTPVSSEQGSVNAYAECTPDPVTGAVPTTITPAPVTTVGTVTPSPVTSTGSVLGGTDPTLPAYALLTTGDQSTDFGFNVSDSASNKIICVENGSVASNKDINASSETIAVRLAGTGTPGGECTTGTGVDSATGSKLTVTAGGQCLGTFTPTACQSRAASVPVPDPPSLAPITAVNPQPKCDSKNTYAAFMPGLYTDVSLLNTPCTDPKKGPVAPDWEWLSPGAYYFDYGATPWSWPAKRLIGGTPVNSAGDQISGLKADDPSTFSLLSNVAASPGACADPAGGVAEDGVAMVFGNKSVVAASHQGVAEICATYTSGSPPIAIYGLAADQTVTKSGGGTVVIPAETMCSSGCGSNSLIQTDSSGLTEIYVKGYVYAPQAQMLLNVKNTVGQVFNWGIIIRNLKLVIVGSSPKQPVIHLPKPFTGINPVVTTSTPPPYPTTSVSNPAPIPSLNYTIRYVNVWICTVASLQAAGQPACPHTSASTANVQARVLTDVSGVPLQVLSWNPIR